MSQGFSKENQSSVETSYRFGAFALSPKNRLLQRDGEVLPLQAKSLDALLCLVRRAKHLVSKQELISTLWPAVHGSEANLTNIIVSLRKVVGRDAIRTVSKYGYSFELQVTGEPGIARATYERFVRARDLTAQRSMASMTLARDLLSICVAEDPGFAPGWAWLGRCCWFLGKFSVQPGASLELAQAALQRAFALDPDLASAHQFFTLVQTDTGQAEAAMIRLTERLRQHPGEPESLTGLVQVFRFCGLLEESIATHEHAVEMDAAAVSSVAHSLFLAGRYESAIQHYGGRGAYYLDAATWAAMGESRRAIGLLRERLEKTPVSELMNALMASLLALLEGRNEDALRLMESADTTHDPEIRLYFARHYARMGLAEAAMQSLKTAALSGFQCAPETLRSDEWFDALRQHEEFGALLSAAESHVARLREELATHRRPTAEA